MSEKKYVDADVFVECMAKITELWVASAAIKSKPDKEVQEVRHGSWIERMDEEHNELTYSCSLCGGWVKYLDIKTKKEQKRQLDILLHSYKFCPACGARMRKDVSVSVKEELGKA